LSGMRQIIAKAFGHCEVLRYDKQNTDVVKAIGVRARSVRVTFAIGEAIVER
jgi:hypothetical protein